MPEPERDVRRRPLSFGAHQAMEYLVGILLALTAAHLPPDTAGAALGVAIAVVGLAAVTDGPLGGWRVLGRQAHLVLDVVLLMVLAASPVLLGFGNITVVVLAETLAVIFAVLVRRTSYASSKRRPRASQPPARPVAKAPVAKEAVRGAGRVVGRVGRDGPRALGRFVGRHSKR